MSTWSLRHDDASPSPVTQTLEEWGLSNVVVTTRSFAAGTLQMTCAGDFDASALFAYGDRITLLEGSTVRWTGRVRQLPSRAAGAEESRDYIAEDVLGDLARRTMTQPWRMWDGEASTEISQPRLVLFRDIDAEPVSVGAQLTAVITAAAAAGIDVQMGSAASMTANPHAIGASMMSYLEALKLCAAFAPDLCTQVDPTTDPPTINFIRRVNATEREIAVIDHSDEFECSALEDQRINNVALVYQKNVVVDGQNLLQSAMDAYPEGTTGSEENALVVVTQLRGQSPPASVAQSQVLQTTAINASSFSWWETLWAELADRNEEATLDDGDIDGPTGVTKQIVNGAQPSWTGSAATVRVTATFNGIVNGVTYVGKKLVALVNASNLDTGTYTQTQTGDQYDPGEAVPSGLAQLLHGALSVVQFSGRHVRAATELDWTIQPGDALNFTGTDDATLTTARASVQSVQRAIDTGLTTLEFGPAPFLSFNDLLDIVRSQQKLIPSAEAEARAGDGTGTTLAVAGAGMGPSASLQPTPDPVTHPFKVGHISGNLFRVETGQIEGQTILADTIDVGSTRPVMLFAHPEYTMSIYNSQHVYGMAVKTGEDAPIITKSTTVFSDVTTVTSAGDEAQAGIAYIDEDNVVSQIALGNIISEWNDDGSLSGKARVTFNKQA